MFCEYFYFFQRPSIMFYTKFKNAHVDKVNLYLEESTSNLYTHNILSWDLKNKIYSDVGDMLDYIQYGKLMASNLQEEIAFHSYYIAHLKDHKNVKTNADLQFDTYAPSIDTNEQE
jgi:hypothetical protein